MKPFYENKSSIVQCFESTNLEFPQHLHDHGEILLVMEGSITVRIMDKSRELKAGDCAVVFPQHIHSYHSPGGSRTRLFIFDVSVTGTYQHAFRKYTPAHPFLPAGELTADGALALDRIYHLHTGNAAPCADCSDLCPAWFHVLFALAWPRLAPVKKEKSAGMELTFQLVQYIMEHFQEPLSLERLARELHVNKYYISDIFSHRLRMNFRRYLNHIRLEYAIQLIKTSNAPLTDVWAESGFNSQRSFNRAFMEIMGTTPREYRKAEGVRRNPTIPGSHGQFNPQGNLPG